MLETEGPSYKGEGINDYSSFDLSPCNEPESSVIYFTAVPANNRIYCLTFCNQGFYPVCNIGDIKVLLIIPDNKVRIILTKDFKKLIQHFGFIFTADYIPIHAFRMFCNKYEGFMPSVLRLEAKAHNNYRGDIRRRHSSFQRQALYVKREVF